MKFNDRSKFNDGGKFNVPGGLLSSSLTGKYVISINSSVIGKYDSIIQSSSFIGKYDILHPVHSNFVIELFDPVFTSGQFTNLRVNRGVNQIDTCEVQFVNPSAANQSYIMYDAPFRIRVNDRLIFSGKIKRIEKDDNINVWNVFAEGAGSDLKERTNQYKIGYGHIAPYYILYDLLPATNWTIITHSGLGDYVDYEANPSPILDHVDNVCKLAGWDYAYRQHSQYTYIEGISGNDITLDYTPTPDGYWDDRYGVMNTGASANYGFTITSHTGDTITVDSVPAGAAVGDQMVLYGKYWLDVGTRIGSNTTGTVAHYVMNENCVWLNKKENAEDIVTSVVGKSVNPLTVGINDNLAYYSYDFYTVDNTSFATLFTNNYTKVVSGDIWSWYYTTTGSTEFYIYDINVLPATGRILVDSEYIDYINKDGNNIVFGEFLDSSSWEEEQPGGGWGPLNHWSGSWETGFTNDGSGYKIRNTLKPIVGEKYTVTYTLSGEGSTSGGVLTFGGTSVPWYGYSLGTYSHTTTTTTDEGLVFDPNGWSRTIKFSVAKNRGRDGTTTANHGAFRGILKVDEMEFEDLTGFPTTNGTIIIGRERIEYAYRDGTKIYNLTRGAGGSSYYCHEKGTYGFDGTYSEDNPEPNSPVHIYGLKSKSLLCPGATTYDAIDKYIQRVLFSKSSNIEYGDLTLLSTDFWEDIRPGDYFKFTDADGTDYEWKITYIHYDQFRPIKIGFGKHDDYVLEDIADTNITKQIANQSQAYYDYEWYVRPTDPPPS